MKPTIIINGTKICSKCKQFKPLEQFNINKTKTSWRASACKLCSRKSTKPIPKDGFKYCKKCNIEKPLLDFHSKGMKNQPEQVFSSCKECLNKTSRRKAPIVKTGFKWCNSCKTEKSIDDFYSDNSKISKIHSQCKQCVIAKIVRNENRKYYYNSKYKITKLLRGRMRSALKKNLKSQSTINLLGCSVTDLKNHLQKTAINNGYSEFNIENYKSSEYHIDHIIPCSSFNLKCSYHQKLCFHYSNLQILTKIENILKSDN